MNELGFALDLMNFETNDQKAEREWNYWVKQQEYTNWNINSSDYQTRYKAAIKSVENLLAQYPNIPMQRSAEQMAQDVLKAIDNGSDLGTELTKINKMIQEKPEYKYLYNQTYRPATATGTTTSTWIGKTVTIDGKEYVEYNGDWYSAEEFNKMFNKAITMWDGNIYNRLNKLSNNEKEMNKIFNMVKKESYRYNIDYYDSLVSLIKHGKI